MLTLYEVFKDTTTTSIKIRDMISAVLKPYTPTTEAGSKILAMALCEWSNGALYPASVLNIYNNVDYWSAVASVHLRRTDVLKENTPVQYDLIGFAFKDIELKPNIDLFKFNKNSKVSYNTSVYPSEIDSKMLDRIVTIKSILTAHLGTYDLNKIMPSHFTQDLKTVECALIPALHIGKAHVISTTPAWLPDTRASFRKWPSKMTLRDLMSFLTSSPISPSTFRQYVVNIKAYARTNKLKLTESSWKQILKPLINKKIKIYDIPSQDLINIVNGIERYPESIQRYWLEDLLPKSGYQHVRCLEYIIQNPSITELGTEALELSKKQMSSIFKVGSHRDTDYNTLNGYSYALYVTALSHTMQKGKFNAEHLDRTMSIIRDNFSNRRFVRQTIILLKNIQSAGLWDHFYKVLVKQVKQPDNFLLWLSGTDQRVYLSIPQVYDSPTFTLSFNLPAYKGSDLTLYTQSVNRYIQAWNMVPPLLKTAFLQRTKETFNALDSKAIDTNDATLETCLCAKLALAYDPHTWVLMRDLHTPNLTEALIATINTSTIKHDPQISIPFEL